MFVLQLMAFKWSEEAPFPNYTTLAKRMGITDKQARRYAKALEDKGFLIRNPRIGSSNSFDLQPLFDALAYALQATTQPHAVKQAA
jgi:DNA-binding IclR family transcriptional regulator